MIPLKIEKQKMDSVLMFRVGEHNLAIDISEVESIIVAPKITSIPLMPHFVSGTFLFNGKVATVIKLNRKLKLLDNDSIKGVIVVTKINESFIGFHVDSVNTLAKYDEFNIENTKNVASAIEICSSDKYGIVLLTSFEKLFSLDENIFQDIVTESSTQNQDEKPLTETKTFSINSVDTSPAPTPIEKLQTAEDHIPEKLIIEEKVEEEKILQDRVANEKNNGDDLLEYALELLDSSEILTEEHAPEILVIKEFVPEQTSFEARVADEQTDGDDLLEYALRLLDSSEIDTVKSVQHEQADNGITEALYLNENNHNALPEMTFDNIPLESNSLKHDDYEFNEENISQSIDENFTHSISDSYMDSYIEETTTVELDEATKIEVNINDESLLIQPSDDERHCINEQIASSYDHTHIIKLENNNITEDDYFYDPEDIDDVLSERRITPFPDKKMKKSALRISDTHRNIFKTNRNVFLHLVLVVIVSGISAGAYSYYY